MNFNFHSFLLKTLIILSGISVLTNCKRKKNVQDHPSAQVGYPAIQVQKEIPKGVKTPEGMIWVSGKEYMQGAVADDTLAMHHEKPAHTVAVDGFFIDQTEVTNAQFAEFVAATKYVTVAEREIKWSELKKQVPPGTPKPHDSILQPGSLVFKKSKDKLPNLYDYSQWWSWKIGANWKHPYGPDSTIEGKDNYPVVHVTYEDAMTYCKWANRRLPTEAEWELASRGATTNAIYTWENSALPLTNQANTWEGTFPEMNTKADGYEGIAPVKSFPANSIGLYDIAGNVWELTQDWYHVQYYQELKDLGTVKNPLGPKKAYNPNNPRIQEKVIRGGSFLCNESYCASYRNSARMANALDSSSEHIGFRTVVTPEMLQR